MQNENEVPVLKPEYLKMIPEFSGDIELLPRFIATCDKLISKFYNTVDPTDFQNDYLMDSILAKVKGDAQKNISSCILNTWSDLKRALINTYSDKRDIHSLVIEMCTMKQHGESVFDFYNSVQTFINLQVSYIANHNLAGSEYIKKFVADLALRTLLRGLKEPLGSLMRTKNPRDMNEALSILINDFQIETTSSVKVSNHQQGNNRNTLTQYQNSTSRYVPPMIKGPNNHSNTRQYNQPQSSGWNQGQHKQPFNSNNNYNNNNNWRNNNQWRSNNNQNVWSKPSNQPVSKPTPMSVTTRNSRNHHNIESCNDNVDPNQYLEYTTQDQDFSEQNPQYEQVAQESDEADAEIFCIAASEPTEF